MARSKNKMHAEDRMTQDNSEILRQKRQEQGCIPGFCTIHCEDDHRAVFSTAS